MSEKVLERKDMVFHNHIENHFKKEHPDWKVMCKICGKSFNQIIKEEGSKLVSVCLASESVDLKWLEEYVTHIRGCFEKNQPSDFEVGEETGRIEGLEVLLAEAKKEAGKNDNKTK